MTQRTAQKGFTLVELLLYIGIISIITVTISYFMQVLLSARVKHETVTEVEQQGIEALTQIGFIIRQGKAITIPLAGTNGSSLTVAAYAATADPTIIDVGGGALRVTEGVGGSPVPITNTRVSVSNFTARNLSRPGTPGVIQYEFTIAHANQSGRNEYSYQKTFSGTTTIRK